jgi:hypothetical protein
LQKGDKIEIGLRVGTNIAANTFRNDGSIFRSLVNRHKLNESTMLHDISKWINVSFLMKTCSLSFYTVIQQIVVFSSQLFLRGEDAAI